MRTLLIALIFLVVSCSTYTPMTYGGTMVTEYERNLSTAQFDSICKAEQITNNLSKWSKSTFKDFESGVPFNEYLFIKKLVAGQTVFRCQRSGDSIFVTKRITR